MKKVKQNKNTSFNRRGPENSPPSCRAEGNSSLSRRGQGLPMTTIALVLLALVVMAVVIIWYLVYSGKIDASTVSWFDFSGEKAKIDCSNGCPPGYYCCTDTNYCVPTASTCPPP